MNNVGLLAKPSSYVKYNSAYRLSGKYFLALPGSLTNDPNEGYLKYNNNLIKHLTNYKRSYSQRVKALFVKYSKNRRIIKINEIFSSGSDHYHAPESEIEKILFLMAFIAA